MKWCQIIPSIYVSLFDSKSPFNDPSITLQMTPLASIVKFKSLGLPNYKFKSLYHLWANLEINCMSLKSYHRIISSNTGCWINIFISYDIICFKLS